jgi:hypothetical protein
MHVQNVFSALSNHYYDNDRVVCEISFERAISDLRTVYGFIYQHIELFRILLLEASGSTHADFVHELVTWEMQHTLAYLQRLGIGGDCILQSNTSVLHTISEGYINAILEPVRHNMSLEEALHNLELTVRTCKHILHLSKGRVAGFFSLNERTMVDLMHIFSQGAKVCSGEV